MTGTHVSALSEMAGPSTAITSWSASVRSAAATDSGVPRGWPSAISLISSTSGSDAPAGDAATSSIALLTVRRVPAPPSACVMSWRIPMRTMPGRYRDWLCSQRAARGW